MVSQNKTDEAFQELAVFLFELYKKLKRDQVTELIDGC